MEQIKFWCEVCHYRVEGGLATTGMMNTREDIELSFGEAVGERNNMITIQDDLTGQIGTALFNASPGPSGMTGTSRQKKGKKGKQTYKKIQIQFRC